MGRFAWRIGVIGYSVADRYEMSQYRAPVTILLIPLLALGSDRQTNTRLGTALGSYTYHDQTTIDTGGSTNGVAHNPEHSVESDDVQYVSHNLKRQPLGRAKVW